MMGVGLANGDLVVAGQFHYQISAISEVTWVLSKEKKRLRKHIRLHFIYFVQLFSRPQGRIFTNLNLN